MINSKIINWSQSDLTNQILEVMNELRENFTFMLLMNNQVVDKAKQESSPFGRNHDDHQVIYENIEQLIELEKLNTYNSQSIDQGQHNLQNVDVEEKNEIEKSIQSSTISLCSSLRNMPMLVQQLKNFNTENSQQNLKLIHSLAELQELYTKVVKTTFSEENDEMNLQKSLKSKIYKEEIIHQHLEQELESVRASRESQLKFYETTKIELENELEELLQDEENQKQNFTSEHNNRLDQLIKSWTNSIKSKQSSLDNISVEESKNMLKWAESEKELRRKIKISENEKFESAMEIKSEFEKMDNEYQELQMSLKKAQTDMVCLQKQFNEIRAKNSSEDPDLSYTIELVRRYLYKNSLNADQLLSKIKTIQVSWRRYLENQDKNKSKKPKKKKKSRKKNRAKTLKKNQNSNIRARIKKEKPGRKL